ncbi:MAG: kelch repeat-containing protein, partial [Flavitalea sp.]
MHGNRNIVMLAGFCLVILSGCVKSTSTSTTTVGNWVRSSDFEGKARTEAVAATASNGKVYVGLGFDGTNRLNDFWEYDATNDFWLKKKEFPGVARNSAVAFSANGKVYVGTGYDGVNYLTDFWQYDPATDEWLQVADFPGSARYGSVAFSIADKGYVCAGYDGNYLKDFYEYDPVANTWVQKISPGGFKRNEAVAFVIDDKAYLCTGVNNGEYVNDLFVYDPSVDKWTEKRQITNVSTESYDDLYTTIARTNGVAFVLNGKGYVTTGLTSGYVNNTWEYDPATDVWVEKTAFEGAGREGAVGFSIDNRAFVGLGKSASLR